MTSPDALCCTATLAHDSAHALAGALEDLVETGRYAVSLTQGKRDEWLLEVFCTEIRDADALDGFVAAASRRLGIGPVRFTRRELAERDWLATARQALAPVSAGRFFVHGSQDRARARLSGINLEIDANMAFGTGHHATTRTCLLLLDRILKQRTPAAILDLGCGSGILAIAAARATPPQTRIIASDIDPLSIAIARQNATLNRAGRRIAFIAADGLADPRLRDAGPFDLIMANILANTLSKLAPDIAGLLEPGGDLILSGLLNTQARALASRYRGFGFAAAGRLSEKDWTSLHLIGR
jgi:ribosomal protein L11 methyltransferase